MNNKNEHDTYIIPPNFIDSGTFFGGMFKARNAIEAGAVLLLVGVPVFSLGLSLTVKIIILCLTALPLALLALIGVSGESLTSFAYIFLCYLKKRRVIGSVSEEIKQENRAGTRKRLKLPAIRSNRPPSSGEQKQTFPLSSVKWAATPAGSQCGIGCPVPEKKRPNRSGTGKLKKHPTRLLFSIRSRSICPLTGLRTASSIRKTGGL